MNARIRKSMQEKDQGFTLIELLVVMIIIGILSAIAIPVFLSQREKAQDSAAKADVSTLGKEIATYYVDSTTAPTIGGGSGSDYTIDTESVGNSSANVILTTPVTTAWTATTWCVHVTNAEGDKATTANGGYSYSAANGLQNAACP